MSIGSKKKTGILGAVFTKSLWRGNIYVEAYGRAAYACMAPWHYGTMASGGRVENVTVAVPSHQLSLPSQFSPGLQVGSRKTHSLKETNSLLFPIRY